MSKDCSWVPPAIKAHPLGLMAMWGWALLGVALAIPALGDDPKPWPDVLWPALLTEGDAAEAYAMGILAVGMTISGLAFILSQVCLTGRWKWPQYLRHQSLWLSCLVNAYVIIGILIKAIRDPDQVAWWWPLSLFTWAVTLFLLVLATKRSLHAAKGERFYEPSRGDM
jgi:hypothetical protein